MAHIIFRRAAKRELRDAALWYNGQAPGLGAEFIESVRECVELIRSHPEIFPRVYRHVRRAVVKRFPFSLLYFTVGDRITVLSVFHTSRDPEVWKRRL